MSARQDSGSPALSVQGLADICSFVYDRTGMLFGESKRYYIERRVVERIDLVAGGSLKTYMGLLRSDRAEAERLINSVTVNETYFYREEHQLACLGRSLLPELIKSRGPGDRIRIWSMPCSSGEEPYSIAIWLLENWALVDAYNIEIVGSDIDTAVMSQAAEGLYGQRALSRLPEDVVERYFEEEKDGQWRLIADLRESVTLKPANIVDRASLASVGRFDVIFCRNLLIYFDEAARTIAVDNLHAFLAPGGFICLGHTESMTRISDKFETARFPDAIVYRRLGEQ